MSSTNIRTEVRLPLVALAMMVALCVSCSGSIIVGPGPAGTQQAASSDPAFTEASLEVDAAPAGLDLAPVDTDAASDAQPDLDTSGPAVKGLAPNFGPAETLDEPTETDDDTAVVSFSHEPPEPTESAEPAEAPDLAESVDVADATEVPSDPAESRDPQAVALEARYLAAGIPLDITQCIMRTMVERNVDLADGSAINSVLESCGITMEEFDAMVIESGWVAP